MSSVSTSNSSYISWIAPCVCTSPVYSECCNLDIWQRSSIWERFPLCSRWQQFWMGICIYSSYLKYQRFSSSCLPVLLTLVGLVVGDSTEAQSCNAGVWSEAHRWMLGLLVVRPSLDSWLNFELSRCDIRFSQIDWRIWEKAPKKPAKFEWSDIGNRFTVSLSLNLVLLQRRWFYSLDTFLFLCPKKNWKRTVKLKSVLI